MNQPDLTPVQFTKRMQTRTAVRRWLIPLSVCAAFAIVCTLIAQTRTPDTSGQLAEERLLQAQSRVESGQRLIETRSALLTQQQRELQAAEHLTLRPDWSGVLSLVAAQFDDRLVMMGFELGDARASGVRGALGPLAADTPDGSVWLILDGVAAANSDVPGLILRLEQLGLFDRVVMTRSQREPFAGDARTRFTLACKVQ